MILIQNHNHFSKKSIVCRTTDHCRFFRERQRYVVRQTLSRRRQVERQAFVAFSRENDKGMSFDDSEADEVISRTTSVCRIFRERNRHRSRCIAVIFTFSIQSASLEEIVRRKRKPAERDVTQVASLRAHLPAVIYERAGTFYITSARYAKHCTVHN